MKALLARRGLITTATSIGNLRRYANAARNPAAPRADDATLTVQTDHAVFSGADEIRRMFTDFCAGSTSIFHEIKNIVVEPEARKVATEQSYIGELVDGTKNDMHNCNFFDVDAAGKFSRVIIWMAGTNPLK